MGWNIEEMGDMVSNTVECLLGLSKSSSTLKRDLDLGWTDSSLFSFPSTRRLDANLISLVPERSFEGLSSLRHLWLDDNALTEIPVRALNNLPALQAMTLALNRIRHIPDYVFQNLTSLVVL